MLWMKDIVRKSTLSGGPVVACFAGTFLVTKTCMLLLNQGGSLGAT